MPISQAIADVQRRTKSEIDNPWDDMISFFIETNSSKLKTLFLNVLETCLTAEDINFSTAEKRYELVSNFKRIERFIDAVNLFLENEKDLN
jgi:hypothetical protein